ncbi:hypothetical protein HK096_007168 [Nowakowskiella sp. JEL0078]|nr:hypothetical protein HK096_007168 [Nowakowskiella sp. JEL0078]
MLALGVIDLKTTAIDKVLSEKNVSDFSHSNYGWTSWLPAANVPKDLSASLSKRKLEYTNNLLSNNTENSFKRKKSSVKALSSLSQTSDFQDSPKSSESYKLPEFEDVQDTEEFLISEFEFENENSQSAEMGGTDDETGDIKVFEDLRWLVYEKLLFAFFGPDFNGVRRFRVFAIPDDTSGRPSRQLTESKKRKCKAAKENVFRTINTCKIAFLSTNPTICEQENRLLFSRERRSIWKCLQRELFPQLVVDAYLHRCFTADIGTPFFIDEELYEVISEPSFYTDISGGIICEGMGMGKTLSSISLILSTLGQRTIPPPDSELKIDIQFETCLTPYKSSIPNNTGAKSLFYQSLLILLKQPIAMKNLCKSLPSAKSPIISDLLENFPPYFLLSDSEEVLQNMRNTSRSKKKQTRILLSSTTLILIPDTLYEQWITQINAHVNDNALKYFAIPTSSKRPMPPAIELIKYDLVIITNTRFSSEASKSQDNIHSTPLMQVRWLRLIVDEGHNMARDKNSSFGTYLVSMLYVERRWACTGTPLPNANKNQEKLDLKSLQCLCEDFLKVREFEVRTTSLKKKKSSFTDLITTPFLNGEMVGRNRLQSLLERIMVKNSESDIKKEINLPELHEQIVSVEMNELQRITHNCLIAFFVVNTVLSERVDQRDYNLLQLAEYHIKYALNSTVIDKLYRNSKVLDVGLLYVLNNPEILKNFSTVQNMPKIDSEYLSIKQVEKISEEENSEIIVCEQQNIAVNKPENCDESREDMILDERIVLGWSKRIDIGEDFVLLDANHCDQLKKSVNNVKKEENQIVNYENYIEIQGTMSSKLAYIGNELPKYSKLEKMIVYTQWDTEIEYISEFCHLSEIRHLIFSSKQSGNERSQSIVTFNTSDTNVFIMNQKMASWGIDLSTATRVYFMSPIWQSAMEQQAIKRAHRIGAKSDVYVKVLVSRGSFEEDIVKNKTEMSMEGLRDNTHIADSRRFKNLIEAAKFINPLSENQKFEFGEFDQNIHLIEGIPVSSISKKKFHNNEKRVEWDE